MVATLFQYLAWWFDFVANCVALGTAVYAIRRRLWAPIVWMLSAWFIVCVLLKKISNSLHQTTAALGGAGVEAATALCAVPLLLFGISLLFEELRSDYRSRKSQKSLREKVAYCGPRGVRLA